jgi:hypothetical protein
MQPHRPVAVNHGPLPWGFAGFCLGKRLLVLGQRGVNHRHRGGGVSFWAQFVAAMRLKTSQSPLDRSNDSSCQQTTEYHPQNRQSPQDPNRAVRTKPACQSLPVFGFFQKPPGEEQQMRATECGYPANQNVLSRHELSHRRSILASCMGRGWLPETSLNTLKIAR